MDPSLISSYPADIYYLAIGSASHGTVSEVNAHQFPPFLRHQHNSGKNITLINIDSFFEDHYYMLTQFDMFYIDSGIKNVKIFITTGLVAIYITQTVNLHISDDNDDLRAIEKMVELSFNNDSLFFGALYTGISGTDFENHLYKHFSLARDKFMSCVHFNYLVTDNTCLINVKTNFPIISDGKIMKIDNRSNNEIMEFYKKCNNNFMMHCQLILYYHNQMQMLWNYDYVALRRRKLENYDIFKTWCLPEDYMSFSVLDLQMVINEKFFEWIEMFTQFGRRYEDIVTILNTLLIISYNDTPNEWSQTYSNLLQKCLLLSRTDI